MIEAASKVEHKILTELRAVPAKFYGKLILELNYADGGVGSVRITTERLDRFDK